MLLGPALNSLCNHRFYFQLDNRFTFPFIARGDTRWNAWQILLYARKYLPLVKIVSTESVGQQLDKVVHNDR